MAQLSTQPQLLPRPASRNLFDDIRQQSGPYLLLLALLAILGVTMVYPLLNTLVDAFHGPNGFTLQWITGALRNDGFRGRLENSLLMAVVVTIGCNVIAMPLALISRRYEFRGKSFLSGLVLVPLVLPPFVGAIGLKMILGTFGSLTVFLQHLHILAPKHGINWLYQGGFWACAGLITLGLYPIAYLNLQASLANIDPAMLEAAENLGGRRIRNFFKVTLPLAMPGIFAGSTIIFIWAFTELGTPLLLDYPNVVSRELFDLLASSSGGNSSEAAAKISIVLTIALVVYLMGKNTLGRQAYAMTSKAAVAAAMRKLGFGRGLLAALPFLFVTAMAVLPHIGVVLYSVTAIGSESGSGWGQPGTFGWYRTVLPSRYTWNGYTTIFQMPDIFHSIVNSIKYASVSTLADVVLGISIAWILVRTKICGRTLLDSLAMLPLAVPGLVMAMGYVIAMQKWPFNDDWRISLRNNPFLILVIAYAVRRLPYLVRAAAGGLQQTSVTLEEAAANMGASPLRTLWKVTLPLIMANLIAGALLTFAFAMLEVSDSLILAPIRDGYPITRMIQALGSDTSSADNVRNAAALGVLGMGLLIVTIMSAAMLMGKRLGTIFRA